jgi:hypothetical protein
MPRSVSLTKAYTVSANSTTMDTLYTVAPAKKFKLKKIVIDFPPTTANNLRVEFFNGSIKILPTDFSLFYVGDNTKIPIEVDVDLVSGESLRVRLQNVSTTQSNSCVIQLEGWEE